MPGMGIYVTGGLSDRKGNSAGFFVYAFSIVRDGEKKSDIGHVMTNVM